MENEEKMNPEHWANRHERGHRFFLKLTSLMVRYLPLPLMRIATAVVVLYFYLTSPAERRHIRAYQARLRSACPATPLPRRLAVYRQFMTFGEAIADRFAVWQHKITYADLVLSDPDNVYAEIRKHREQRGQIFVCSHLGNVEVCRALVSHHEGFRLNVLVHSKHAEAFNRALKEAGASDISLVQVSDLDAAKMLELAQKLDRGEWIAIATDRTPVKGEKTVAVPFLGTPAPLPQGAWLLAGLLKAKTNTLFVLKQQGRYHLRLRKFADVPQWPRGARDEAIAASARRYAAVLAEEAALAPLQWFNFYDFWNDNAQTDLLPPQY